MSMARHRRAGRNRAINLRELKVERTRGGCEVENIKRKLLDQFHELSVKGYELMSGKNPDALFEEVDGSLYLRWRAQVVNLLDRVLPAKSSLRKRVSEFLNFREYASRANEILNTLCAVEADFKSGIFDDLEKRVEAVVSVDYMEQAEGLIHESTDASKSYIPAAVLAGAVLEKSLRTLCIKNDPPISVTKPGGKKKTMNPLIDDLKAADVFNEIYAKQLKTWADIRNAAAHGQFEAFTKEQVASMIAGINQFLVNYMQ